MKTSALTFLAALCLFALVVPQSKADDRRRNNATEINRILTGLKISPVRLNLRGKNIVLVGLGSYLVNAAGACNDCHTNPPFQEGGNPFQGQPEQIDKENFLEQNEQLLEKIIQAQAYKTIQAKIAQKNMEPPAGLTYVQDPNVPKSTNTKK